MPKATDSQRRAFGHALSEALRDRAIELPPGTRTDEWLAEQIGLSSQAIRNYLSGIREPNRGRIAMMEAVLDLERHDLGRHLGIGVSDSERLDRLEAQVEAMNAELQRLLRRLEPATQPDAPSPPTRSRAGRSAS